MLFGNQFKRRLPTADEAMPGRSARPFEIDTRHAVLDTPLEGPWPEGTQVAYFAMGCFWGAERIFWRLPGVVTTAVGYQGGTTPHPTYEETCSGRTGHTEAVLVAYDPAVTSYDELLRVFWESHDPTQGNRQGNDVGTQYRSAAYWMDEEQRQALEASRQSYQQVLDRAGFAPISTDVRPVSEAGPFFYAEDYHQQYLHKVPNGYCGIGGTGVACPVGAAPAEQG